MARRSFGKRALRWAALVLLGLPVLIGIVLVGALLYVRSDGGRERVRSLVLGAVRARVPGLSLQHIGGDYTHSIVLDGVRIRDEKGRPAVEIERLALEFRLLPLLRHKIVVRSIEIVRPAIAARVLEDGTLNLAHLVRPAQDKKASGPFDWAVNLSSATIRGGRGVLIDADGQRTSAELDLVASASFDGTANGAARIERLGVAIVQAGKRYALEGTLSATLAGERIEARISRLEAGGVLTEGRLALEGRARGSRDRIDLTLEGTLPRSGSIHVEGALGAPKDAPPWYDVRTKLARIDPHLVAKGLAHGHVGGILMAKGRGTPLEEPSRTEIGIDLAPSLVQGVRLDVFRVDATSQNGAWQLKGLTVHAPGAQIRARGQGSKKRVALELEATLNVEGARALPLHGVIPPGLHGLGRFQLRVQGDIPPSNITVEGTGALSHFAFNTTRVDAARLAIHAVGLPRHPKGTLSLAIDRLKAGTTRIQHTDLSADVALLKGVPSGKVVLRASQIAQGQVALDAVSFDARSDGQILRMNASARGPRASGTLAAHGTIRPEEAKLRIDHAELGVPRQRFRLLGPADIVFRPGDLVSIANLSLDVTGDRLGGQIGLDGFYRLKRHVEPSAEAHLRVRDARYGGLRGLGATLDAILGTTRAEAKLEGHLGRFPLHAQVAIPLETGRDGKPRLATRGPLALRIDASNVALHELPAPLNFSRRGLRHAILNLHAAASGDIAAPRVEAKLALSDAAIRELPRLDAELRVDAGERASKVAAAVQEGGITALSIEATTDLTVGPALAAIQAGEALPDAAVHGKGRLGPLDLHVLEKLDAKLAGVSGLLSGDLDLEGTLRAPRGRAHLGIAHAQVDAVRFGTFQIDASGDRARQRAEVRLEQQDGGHFLLHLDHAPEAKPPLSLALEVRRFDIGFARALVTSMREVGGRLEADVHATGALPDPVITGRLALHNGKLGPVGQPTIRGIEIALGLTSQQIAIERVSAASGGGTLAMHGTVGLEHLQPTRLALQADANDFVLAWGGVTGAKLNGRFLVRGAMGRQAIDAQLEVPDASLWVPKLDTGRKLHRTSDRSDVVFLDGKLGAPNPADARQPVKGGAKRELRAVGKIGTFYVRGKELDLELEGNLHAITSEDGRPALSGQVEVRRGHINIQGRRYSVDRAILTWNGDPDDMQPQLDIQLTHDFPDATVTITLRGTAKKPELVLTSDPSLDSAQIVSLIVTGQAGGSPSSGKVDATGLVATMVLGKIADKLAPELGVDVIRVEQKAADDSPGAETDTRVEVGKYLSDDVYLSYVHVFGADPQHQNSNEADVEYRMTRRWILQTAFGDAGVGGVDLFWTYRY